MDTLPVSGIMNPSPATIEPDRPVAEVAVLMRKADTGGVIVMDGPDPVGIVTERDIVRKVVASGTDPARLRAEDVMTSDLVVASPGVDVSDVAAIMAANQVRRLPIVSESGLVGVVTDRDLLAVSPALFDLARESMDRQTRRREIASEEYGPGKCESCGTFSDTLVTANGVVLCDDCLDDQL